MLESISERSVDELTERPSPEQSDADTVHTTAFRIGRLLYGGILAMMAVDGIRNADERAQYAESKGVPFPQLATLGSHVLLLGGAVGVSLWRAPKLAASAVAAFFFGVTPAMHDFWTVDDPDQKQQQTTHFLKNAALLGTALSLIGIAESEDT